MDNRYGYGQPAEDKWYKWQGQKPPERTTHLTEEELQDMFNTNLKDHQCQWQQSGAYIFCDVAEFEHGKRITTKERLAGQDEQNQPILVPHGPILRTDV